MIEYDNKVKSWAASAKNKCAHLPISFRLRHAPTKIATAEAFQQLETFFEKVTDHSWIMCNVCNFRIMCPHFHDFMKIKDAPYDHICKKLFKYALKSDTTEDASVYCKICGEKIYEINDDLPNSIYGSFDSGLKNKIWSLAMNILLSVQFSNPLDYRKLSNEIAESILPYVISAESTHAKRKKRITREDSLDETHVDPITHLLMVIYIHAFILDMIASSSNDISFNGAKRGSKISVFAEVMFKNIITTNKNIIDQIDNITIEYIKTHFSNAYKLLHQNGDLSYTVPNPEEELAINTTTIDPTYRYMVQVAKQMGDLPNRMAKTPNECKKEFELVMGNSLPNIIASTKAAMKDPILASIFLRKANMEIPIGTTWAFLLKDPRLNLYSHMYTRSGKKGGNDIVADGGYITADGGKQRPHGHSRHAHGHPRPAHGHSQPAHGHPRPAHGHSQPAHSHPKPVRRSPQAPNDPMAEAIFNESYDLFVDYTKNIVNQTLLDEYNEKIKSFKAREKEWLSGRFVTYLKSFYDFKFKLGGQFSIQDIPITMLYDENGHKHKWGIFVYAADGAAADDVSSAGALVEITNPFKARSGGEIGPHHVLVDKKCTVCGILRSQISTLSVEKTTVELKNNREKSAFFLFYKSRCPIGGVHEYAQKTNACIKCGLNDAKTNEYYKKYHDRFNEQKIEIKNNQNVFNVDTAADTASATSTNTATAVARFSKWEPNYTPIVELAAFANTSTVVIEAIGNMDGRPYADIIKGVDIPAEPKNSLDPRIYATDSEVRLILTNYNMLRNAPKITNLKPHIADFLESIPASDWGQLATLPDIKGDYYERLAHILKTDTASNAYKFIVQSLCEMILKISQPIGVEWMDKLKMDYAKKEISVILHSQKMFSKHGNFNWSIFDVGDDDVVDVGDEAASEADTEKDFYSGDIDYDVSEANPNNDPE
jgi:ribosomal protein L37E